MKTKKEQFYWDALHKMAEIAGFKYEDCIIKTKDGEPDQWDFKKEWTKEQESQFSEWFFTNFEPKRYTKKLKESYHANFMLMYAFRIKK